MKYIGTILLMIGIAAADSVNVMIPLALIACGAVILRRCINGN